MPKPQKDPLVSVIMPSHNSETYISESINSVINGNYENYELLIADDNSNEETQQILQKYAKNNNRIKIINLPKNKTGAAHARNAAIEQASGKYISFLDSDDVWKKDKLTKQINFMQEHNIDFCYSDYEYIDEKSKKTNLIRRCPKKMSYLRMLIGCSIGCLTVIYNAEKIGKIKIPDIKKRNDYALWCLILKKAKKGEKCPGILAEYRKTNSSLSSGNKTYLIKYHYSLHRKINKKNILASIFFTTTNIINYLINIAFREKKVPK